MGSCTVTESESQKKGTKLNRAPTETEQDSVGSWAQKPSHILHFLFVGTKFQIS